jgi:endonuclease/exonuclease/phosphatase (EEP) superfamily protein YafD
MPRNTWVGLLNEDPRGLSQDGLTLATFTTSAPVFPTLVLPANYLKVGRMIHIRARGLWAATGTPTYTFRLQNTVGTTVTLVTGAAITVSALTNQSWEVDIQVQCRTEGTSGTVLAMGDLNMGGVTGTQYFPATGTAPAAVTVDTTIAQTWGLEIAASASSASNTVKGLILEVKSLN